MTVLASTVRIPAVMPRGSFNAYLVFQHGRGAPLLARGQNLVFLPFLESPNVLSTTVVGSLGTDDRAYDDGKQVSFEPHQILSLEVFSRDEITEPVRLCFEAEDVFLGLHSQELPCLDPELLWVDSSTPKPMQLLSPLHYHNALEALLLPPQSLRDEKRFFFDLERHTAIHLRELYVPTTSFDLRRITDSVNVLMDVLVVRLRRRHREKLGHVAYARPSLPDGPVLAAVDYIAALFETLVGRHFGNDMDRLAAAVECFANGELRTLLQGGVWTTQPSSGYFFLFGELAQLAVEAGVRGGTWERIARAMVASQLIFARTYAPCKNAGNAGMLDFCSCGFRASLPRRIKLALSKQYDGKTFHDVCEAAATNTATTLPAEQ